jgi:predicted O-methyltransferase YrrM
MASQSPEQLEAWRSSAADYRALYMSAGDVYLAVPRSSASLLYILTRGRRARTVVEFGSSFGISTLHLAAALRDNGGGRLIGTEFEPGKVAGARRNLADAGLDDLAEIRDGDALETLSRDLPEEIDLVFLDGAKNLYLPVLGLLEARLPAGALLIADNAENAPDYLERIQRDGYVSSTLVDHGLSIAVRTG